MKSEAIKSLLVISTAKILLYQVIVKLNTYMAHISFAV